MGQTKSTMINSSSKPDEDCFIDSKKFDLFANKSDTHNPYDFHNHPLNPSSTELRRGRSFINPRSIRSQASTPPPRSSVKHGNSGDFKRINSLPPFSRMKLRRNQYQNEFIEHRTLSKGFDMIRHHFGQKDCEWTPMLTELETSILLLNGKVSDLEQSRRECWNKLAQLKIYLEMTEQHQNQSCKRHLWSSSQRISDNNLHHQNFSTSGHLLRIRFIENYMTRLENLLRIDHEPFMASACNIATMDMAKNVILQSSTEDQNPSNHNKELSAMEKCQQIKQCYDYLLKTVMPQLYGNNDYFNHHQRSNNHATNNGNVANKNHQKFRSILLELRQKVQKIPSQPEKQLIDAKKAFVQEVDSYLSTLDQMVVKCDDDDECKKCFKK